MSNKTNNERIQKLEGWLADANGTIRGMRLCHAKLREHNAAITRALLHLEGKWYLRLFRWVCRKPSPTDILLKESE